MESKPANLGAFNFGVQLVWGCVLALSLQSRCIELAPAWSVAAYASLAAIGAALAAVVQIVAGVASDRYAATHGHRRPFYLGGVAVAVPALFAFYGGANFTTLCIAFLVLQLGMNVASGPYQAAIPDHVAPHAVGRTAAWMSALQSLGAAAGLLIGGFVTRPQIVASLLAIGLIGSFALTYTHMRLLSALRLAKSGYFMTRTLFVLLASRGLLYLGFYILLGFLVFYVRESLGISEASVERMTAASIFLTFTLAAAVGAVVAGRPSDRYDKRAVASVANALVILALLVLATSNSVALACVAAALAGIGWGAFVTADWALACVLLPQRSIATAMGVWNLAIVLPQMLAPIVAAPLVLYGESVRHGLGSRYAMLAAAVAFFCGTLVLWRLPNVRPMESSV